MGDVEMPNPVRARVDNDTKRAIETAARQPKQIAAFDEFLAECVRWGLPQNVVLESIKTDAATAKQIRADMNAAGLSISLPQPPTWIEVPAADKDKDMPAAWEAPPVVVSPAVFDENGNEVTPAVTRPRKWSENFIFIERDGRYFVPASDGQNYFNSDKLDALSLNEIDPADIPAAAEEIPA